METEFFPYPGFAAYLDERDQLRQFRDEFYIADENTIYLDGNSLGRLPLKSRELLKNVIESQWGTNLIESWNLDWYGKSAELGNKIAAMTGAGKGEVIVCDSTSINLYKLAWAALKTKTGRNKIVSDEFNFPTDLYILQGIVAELDENYEIELAGSTDSISADVDDLKKKINQNTALVVLSLVAFKSAFLYDLKEITEYAHRQGSLILWDLSHAAGVVPVNLNEAGADMAVGCTYKYLNGGPGAPAFLYVRNDLQEKLNQPVQGWFGDSNPFAFNLNFKPEKGIAKFLVGTPPVLSMMAIEPGLDILLEAGVDKVREKSILQSEYLIYLIRNFLIPLGFNIGSPLNCEQRGSHVSLRHREGYRVCQALIHPENSKLKIIPDFREPDNIRLGITPLYTTFNEIYLTVRRLEEIITSGEFLKFREERKGVT